MELQVSAFTPDCVRAAVENGAAAVRVPLMRQNADLRRMMAFCRLWGVKVYVTLPNATDKTLLEMEPLVRQIFSLGADAAVIGDPGVMLMFSMAAPGVKIHAPAVFGVRNAEAAAAAAGWDVARLAVTDPEWAASSGNVETEYLIHGTACGCLPGRCLWHIAENRAPCRWHSAPCLDPAGIWAPPTGWDEPRVSITPPRVISRWAPELLDSGLTSLRVEPPVRFKKRRGAWFETQKPGEVVLVTKIYAAALREARPLSAAEIRQLAHLYMHNGPAYPPFEEPPVRHTFIPRADTPLQRTAPGGSVPLRLTLQLEPGVRAALTLADGDDRRVRINGPRPGKAKDDGDEGAMRTALERPLPKPYRLEHADMRIEGDLRISPRAVAGMRQTAIKSLSAKRMALKDRRPGEFKPGVRYLDPPDPPILVVSLGRMSQFSTKLLALRPGKICLPLTAVLTQEGRDAVKAIAEAGVDLVWTLSPHVPPDVLAAIHDRLGRFTRAELLSGDWGQIAAAKALEWPVRGDYGLGVLNSQALKQTGRAGCLSCCVSPALTLEEAGALSKRVPVELFAYGRLPLASVIPEGDGPEHVLSSRKLFLGDRLESLQKLGFWALRLHFTTENVGEVVQVTERYMGRGQYQPGEFTRGRYF
jgi:putative protease